MSHITRKKEAYCDICGQPWGNDCGCSFPFGLDKKTKKSSTKKKRKAKKRK